MTEVRATTAEENQSVTTSDVTGTPQGNYPDDPNQSNAPTNLSIQESRQQLVSLYVRGDSNDARALFSAAAGATEEGWTNLERILSPVKDFVIMGNLPYSNNMQWTGEYAGVGDTRNEDQDAVQTTGPMVQSETASGEPVTETLPQAQPTGTPVPENQPTDAPTDTETDTSAAALIARAREASTLEELDEIEALANGRVTVEDAVDARRDELTKP
jgi:hypothetical protein